MCPPRRCGAGSKRKLHRNEDTADTGTRHPRTVSVSSLTSTDRASKLRACPRRPTKGPLSNSNQIRGFQPLW